MEKKKQSSIEWFINEFSKQIEFVPESELDKWYKDLIPKAKAMHRKEIIDAWLDEAAIFDSKEKAEQYYNETFEGQDNE